MRSFSMAVESPAAASGTASEARIALRKGAARRWRRKRLVIVSRATKSAAMGRSDACAAVEIIKIAARDRRLFKRNRSLKANRNDDKKTMPANTSGISCDTSQGRLVRVAKMETEASRQMSR